LSSNVINDGEIDLLQALFVNGHRGGDDIDHPFFEEGNAVLGDGFFDLHSIGISEDIFSDCPADLHIETLDLIGLGIQITEGGDIVFRATDELAAILDLAQEGSFGGQRGTSFSRWRGAAWRLTGRQQQRQDPSDP